VGQNGVGKKREGTRCDGVVYGDGMGEKRGNESLGWGNMWAFKLSSIGHI